MTWVRQLIDAVKSLTWFEAFVLSTVLFAVGAVGSLAIVVLVLVRLPEDYFLVDQVPDSFRSRHPVIRLLVLVLKNVVGWSLVGLGILLTLLPGQGVLTILIGIMLVDFPGRRRLERWLISRPKVLQAINRLRQRFGKPPLLENPAEKK
ncbi:MAG: hypothetical protein KatS3mg105_4348 [Gemmatales bacterium]|nr:MAG: hypothetical protein KatS3mg105_4348 [Gemmatales bacterium]